MTQPHPLEPDHTALLQTALRAARAAGRHALENRHRRQETVMVAAHDVKLTLDLECQAIAQAVVREAYPQHAILAEESADKGQPADNPHHSPYVWIIDPIDGTVNFTHALPWWCCSVAVQHAGQVVAGVVFAPATDECFSAARGVGAWRNGEPLAVSAVRQMKEAMVLTGLDQKHHSGMPRLALFKDLADHIQKARVMGAAALDMCRVAAGQADAYFETGVYLWDVAAASLIVEMAGGQAENLAEPSRYQVMHLATNGHLHPELRAFLIARLGLT